ncbi:hypothetical protein Sango_1931200 [Sesamum angolense]|uniref:MULE transposase domain-containing protein n=1 Tax=Sesamum angolense TaxID=2727404 RepID=A0AAE2BN62_9LAMI|nr:hypothetical protein Sango_1931200 [Sesamum angolense]
MGKALVEHDKEKGKAIMNYSGDDNNEESEFSESDYNVQEDTEDDDVLFDKNIDNDVEWGVLMKIVCLKMRRVQVNIQVKLVLNVVVMILTVKYIDAFRADPKKNVKGFRNEAIREIRPIIGVDGCHLKGPHGGILLTAVGIDPNNCLYPIAYAVVGSETKQSWEWFLMLLKKDLHILRNGIYTFISDKQKGLLPALRTYSQTYLKVYEPAMMPMNSKEMTQQKGCQWRKFAEEFPPDEEEQRSQPQVPDEMTQGDDVPVQEVDTQSQLVEQTVAATEPKLTARKKLVLKTRASQLQNLQELQ